MAVFGQDIIYNNDNFKLEVIIKEVNPDNVKYIKFDNQGGPIYTILKRDISRIQYMNGTEENISSKNERLDCCDKYIYINIGMNISDNNSNIPLTDEVSNLYISLGYDMFKKKYFKTGIELSYLVKGMQIRDMFYEDAIGDIIEYDYKEHARYLSLNIKNDIIPFDYGIITPYIIFSPKIDFLLGSNSNVQKEQAEENTVLAKYNNIVYGFNTGFGFIIKVKKINLGFEMIRGLDLNMFSEENYASHYHSHYMIYSLKAGFGLK
tara:strand:- start:1050 stop:1841 length:792 start_codon:yes stop_codon:yes gene_type:complete